ncbi:hypothetical protein C8F04DRAFT_1220945 [Mycena alexandri]|uniref:Uncharacterized protein n=1 Tax=Mycena alexandri TaxID=1745969 RepID=A0AAD6X2J8_9AGAR|nr:hypothetical protein C8F04DRAFT_1220945 [Mycena alexandri]
MYARARAALRLFRVRRSGWGNVLQELLLNAELAFRANRAFVTDDYVWARDGGPYAHYDHSDSNSTRNFKLIPARIPLAALLGGLPVGAPLPRQFSRTHPRAVSRAAFERACAEPEVLDAGAVKATLPWDAPASRIFAAWVAALDAHGPCVVIEKDSGQIFDIWLLSSWPAVRVSPIITRFRWPPLITAALLRNVRHFPSSPELLASPKRTYTDEHPPTSLPLMPGLLALHVRRGDFASHCTHLANWGAEFNGYLSGFMRNWGSTTPANHVLYLRRCFPSIPQIVEKVRRVRTMFEARSQRRLTWVYVMTNADLAWLAELEAALRDTQVDVRDVGTGNLTWDGISTSRDLVLTWEQKYVAQAVDMYIATRAEVFIGNGFSILTSNVVMLRMARDVDPRDTHFW